eukprot:349776-Chlamydomonas_euryale.AAC.3
MSSRHMLFMLRIVIPPRVIHAANCHPATGDPCWEMPSRDGCPMLGNAKACHLQYSNPQTPPLKGVAEGASEQGVLQAQHSHGVTGEKGALMKPNVSARNW